MFAPRPLIDLVSGGGRYALDVPVAALAGLSVAFLAFAAPPDLLSGLVESTGLSSLLTAAQPPLGLKARMGIGAAGAVAVFTIAFLLLRWLDRMGTGTGSERREPVETYEEPEMPRLRRRDFHPDAPPRPPLMANWDLGEPGPLAPEPSTPADEASAPAPEAPLSLHDFGAVEPAPPSLPQRSAVVAAVPPTPPPERLSSLPARPAATVAPVAEEPGSIAELMARLEQGLARRRQAPSLSSLPPAPDAHSGSADDRLQSAIESLQRLASRQG
ncbi:hypothetical protein [Sphingosinicella terrae]|uniref:hypothetical protein n=1 Tax=Sphingosinicella terrae TaxID=2172047 RepID=UPI000E0CE670|nr:hypothetical protein [Sphingosinicella terrae]